VSDHKTSVISRMIPVETVPGMGAMGRLGKMVEG
jgi:hypothetical protein